MTIMIFSIFFFLSESFFSEFMMSLLAVPLKIDFLAPSSFHISWISFVKHTREWIPEKNIYTCCVAQDVVTFFHASSTYK